MKVICWLGKGREFFPERLEEGQALGGIGFETCRFHFTDPRLTICCV
jgi:hypothetical protein